MNSQQLEYVRQQLIVATADLSGATKGQLVAFAENAQFTATARSRGRKKITEPTLPYPHIASLSLVFLFSGSGSHHRHAYLLNRPEGLNQLHTE
ncbi:phage antitermination protein Q [Enterobacter hormaechei]|nr:phage antitermination protein Q [Enterobacter hormaechei]